MLTISGTEMVHVATLSGECWRRLAAESGASSPLWKHAFGPNHAQVDGGAMYVATPAKNNGESAAAARSWGQRRGVAAPGWERNTLVGAGTAPAAP